MPRDQKNYRKEASSCEVDKKLYFSTKRMKLRRILLDQWIEEEPIPFYWKSKNIIYGSQNWKREKYIA